MSFYTKIADSVTSEMSFLWLQNELYINQFIYRVPVCHL